MARAPKASGLPRKQPTDDTPTIEGVQHQHHDDDGNVAEDHLHRLGNLRHIHLENGRVEFADGRPAEVIPSVPEGGFVDVPESPMDAAAMQTPATPDPPRDPATASEDGAEWPDPDVVQAQREQYIDEAAREEQRADVADQRRAAIAAAVTDDDRKDMERIGASHPDVVRPAPARQSAADLPGHSIGDITADDAMDSVLFDDTESQLKLERIWLRTAARTILRIGAERHRYGKLADAEQLMALRDQVEHLLTNRGLVRGGGSA
jgi:hypothetical protein